ncbi:hypothetical protein D3C73_1421780 [compost metagenome]
MEVKRVSALSREIFGLPRMRILIEYKAIIIRIPESNPLTFPLVCKSPVHAPAAAPPIKAIRQASTGEYPWEIITAAIAPPVAKLPSTVRSGKSKMRNVI